MDLLIRATGLVAVQSLNFVMKDQQEEVIQRKTAAPESEAEQVSSSNSFCMQQSAHEAPDHAALVACGFNLTTVLNDAPGAAHVPCLVPYILLLLVTQGVLLLMLPAVCSRHAVLYTDRRQPSGRNCDSCGQCSSAVCATQ